MKALEIDDGADYMIEGGPIDLGVGGLPAALADGSTGATGDSIEAPIALTASETWTVSQEAGQSSGEHGLSIGEGIQGARNGLTIDLEHGPVLYLFGDVEIGSLALEGVGAGSEAIVYYEGTLDSSGSEPVSVTDALLTGGGPTGPIEVHRAKLLPAPRIQAKSVTLEPESEVVFDLEGAKAGVSYSQLAASGAIDLAGAKISVGTGASCYQPQAGTVFTLVTTTGALSGSFGEGDRYEYVPIAVDEAADCGNLGRSLEIAYHETGGTETVTGTVIDGQPEPAVVVNTDTPAEMTVSPFVPLPYVPARSNPNAPQAAHAPQSSHKALLRLLSSALAVKRGAVIAKVGCGGGGLCRDTLILTAKTSPRKGRHGARVLAIGSVRLALAGAPGRLRRSSSAREDARCYALTADTWLPISRSRRAVRHRRRQSRCAYCLRLAECHEGGRSPPRRYGKPQNERREKPPPDIDRSAAADGEALSWGSAHVGC